MLQCIGYVKQKGTTKGMFQVDNFAELKSEYLFDIKVIVTLEEVPPTLAINWDYTSIKYVPISDWMMAKQGVKKVEVVGISDKHQIIAVFAGTLYCAHFYLHKSFTREKRRPAYWILLSQMIGTSLFLIIIGLMRLIRWIT